jgi:hypothetical protein
MKINGKPLYKCTHETVLWVRKAEKEALPMRAKETPLLPIRAARISRSPASNQAHNLPMSVYFRPRSWRSDQSASYCYLITHQNSFFRHW